MARPNYKLDALAFAQARADLGLKLDIDVSFEHIRAKDRGALVLGRYSGVDLWTPHTHMIRINPNQTLTSANATLWHELAHALQCERLGSWPRFRTEYMRQVREAGALAADAQYYDEYRAAPLEAEAVEWTKRAKRGELLMLILSAD